MGLLGLYLLVLVLGFCLGRFLSFLLVVLVGVDVFVGVKVEVGVWVFVGVKVEVGVWVFVGVIVTGKQIGRAHV